MCLLQSEELPQISSSLLDPAQIPFPDRVSSSCRSSSCSEETVVISRSGSTTVLVSGSASASETVSATATATATASGATAYVHGSEEETKGLYSACLSRTERGHPEGSQADGQRGPREHNSSTVGQRSVFVPPERVWSVLSVLVQGSYALVNFACIVAWAVILAGSADRDTLGCLYNCVMLMVIYSPAVVVAEEWLVAQSDAKSTTSSEGQTSSAVHLPAVGATEISVADGLDTRLNLRSESPRLDNRTDSMISGRRGLQAATVQCVVTGGSATNPDTGYNVQIATSPWAEYAGLVFEASWTLASGGHHFAVDSREIQSGTTVVDRRGMNDGVVDMSNCNAGQGLVLCIETVLGCTATLQVSLS